MRRFAPAQAALVVLLGILPSMAAAACGGGQCVADLQVSLVAAEQCSLAATPLAFGAVAGSAQGEQYATSALTVTCNFAVPYEIQLSGGGSGDAAARRMEGPAGTSIAYRLYSGTDANCGVAAGSQWGDGTGSTCVVSATHPGSGASQALTIEGRLVLDNPVAGDYVDTVTATITY